MAGYILSCCSTADLSAAHFRQRDIHYVCFHYMLDGTAYPDDLGQSMPFGQHRTNSAKNVCLVAIDKKHSPPLIFLRRGKPN